MLRVCFLNSGPESFSRATSPAGGPCPPAGEVAKPSKETPEGMKRANALRYTEYLGILKRERQITRKFLEGPELRRSAQPPSLGEAIHKVREATTENLLEATGELRDRQEKLFRATVELIRVMKEAEEGPWEAGAGLTEPFLRRWLGEQVSKMEKLKENLDQKGWELGLGKKAKRKCGGAPSTQGTGRVETRREEKG